MPGSSREYNVKNSPDWSSAVRKYGLGHCAAWTLAILILSVFTFVLHHHDALREAEHEAQDYYKLNLQYRSWNANAGGIYASADRIPPNPHLIVPDRDLTTTDGRKLTLVNPAYMTRLVFESIRSQSGLPIISKLTSLKPLNPKNSPDEWERLALLSFEQGKRGETSQVISIAGVPYMRLITPFETESACLTCHAVQGYRVGDVRGGISISIPLARYYALESRTRGYITGGYLLLWFAGMVGITAGARRRFAGDIALSESEAKFRSLFESMQEGFALHEIICDEDGRPVDYRVLELNPACERYLGLDRGDVVGRTAREVMPDMEERWIKIFGEVALGGAPQYFENYSAPLERHFEVNVFCPAPRQFATIVSDVTEQRQLQSEALKAQKLESLGLLAGGIAHDFNNIMTAVIGNISIVRMQLTCQDNKISARLAESERAAMRASDLTRQLLTFARGGEPMRQALDTVKLVREAASFSLHGSKCAVELDLAQELWQLNADAGQIHQVINNLVINSVQAMPDGGSIFIRAKNTIVADQNSLSLMAGCYVKISVIDQGVGIPQENIGRIFDPYFTTKSSGTGLGLASAYSIIKRHGGCIQVTSHDNRGTTFTIHLPATDLASDEGPDASDVMPASGPTTSILLMDDEEMIRDMAQEMLKTLGYEAVTCADGKQAIHLYQAALERREPFAAAILDMTIPGGLGGRDTAESILSIDLEAILILSSGYSITPINPAEKGGLFRGSVAKPYNAQKLGAELERLLTPLKTQGQKGTKMPMPSAWL